MQHHLHPTKTRTRNTHTHICRSSRPSTRQWTFRGMSHTSYIGGLELLSQCLSQINSAFHSLLHPRKIFTSCWDKFYFILTPFPRENKTPDELLFWRAENPAKQKARHLCSSVPLFISHKHTSLIGFLWLSVVLNVLRKNPATQSTHTGTHTPSA